MNVAAAPALLHRSGLDAKKDPKQGTRLGLLSCCLNLGFRTERCRGWEGTGAVDLKYLLG